MKPFLIILISLSLIACSNDKNRNSVNSQKGQNSTFPVGPDVYAKFLDGDLTKYISNHIVYPHDAKAQNIQGTVYVSFVVEKDGSISKVKIIRGVYNSLDSEAVRVVSQMPKWSPATEKGQAQPMTYNLPIKFVLPNENRGNR